MVWITRGIAACTQALVTQAVRFHACALEPQRRFVTERGKRSPIYNPGLPRNTWVIILNPLKLQRSQINPHQQIENFIDMLNNANGEKFSSRLIAHAEIKLITKRALLLDVVHGRVRNGVLEISACWSLL